MLTSEVETGVAMARPDKTLIEERFKEAIDAWVQDARPTGGFVEAVLSNDLREAIGRGDDEAIDNLPHIVAYLYNDCPRHSWGSPAAVRAWRGLAPVEVEAVQP